MTQPSNQQSPDLPRTAEMFRQSEGRYRLLFEHNPLPMWVCDVDTLTFLDVNAAAIKHYGYSREEFLRMGLKDIRRPEDVPAFLAAVAKAGPGVNHPGILRHRKKDGTVILVEITTHFLDLPGHRTELVLANDITDRKQAEDAVKASDLKFRTLFELAPDGIFLVDLTGTFVDGNRAAEALIGYPRQELIGKNLFNLNLLSPDDLTQAAASLAHSAQGLATGPQQYTLLRKDGSRQPVEIRSFPITLEKQKLILGIARDQTEQKKAEQALRASEARLQLQIDRMPIGSITWDPDLRVTSWNPAAEAIFGYTAAEALGRQPIDFLIPRELEALPRQVLDRLRSGECVTNTNPNLTKDGRTILCEWTNVPLTDTSGTCIGLLTMVQDVTERRRMEDQLRESENRLRLIAETTDEVFWMADAGIHRILYISPAYEKVWGRTTESLYEDPRSFLAAIHPEDRPKVAADYELKNSGQPFQHEYRVVRPDGSIRWVWDRAYPVKEPDGTVHRYVGVAQDITERKTLEMQLLRAQRLESIGTLSAGVAHDLNNILAPILMSAQLLELSITDEEQKQFLATIQASAKRGANVVNQVLTFARGAEGERVPFQPRHLLKEMKGIVQETFPKDIGLELSIARDLWSIIGNPTHLHQVLLNLCVNARDAMPEGGQLTISAENRHVSRPVGLFSNAKPGPYVLIQVSDTGQGIPTGIMDKIFEPFFTTKEPGKGTGLGLSTVLGIVRSHGGMIDLQSELGRGSTFQIYLPAVPAAKTQPGPFIPKKIPKGSGECILVVDDEQNVRLVTERTLAQSGYTVVSAANGKEALEVIAQLQGDVRAVVTDIMMPVMDGVALAHSLKQSNPQLPIIACTGWGQEGVQAKLKALGVDGFLQKPYAFEMLLTALHKHLSVEP